MSKVLGIDIGEKRIGIAISDEMAILARPLKALAYEEAVATIKSIVTLEDIDLLVAGFPRQMNGEPSDKAPFVEEFVRMLKEILPSTVIIEFEDESGTSMLAEKRLKERKVDFRNNKELVDIESAVIILQSYLNEKRK